MEERERGRWRESRGRKRGKVGDGEKVEDRRHERREMKRKKRIEERKGGR